MSETNFETKPIEFKVDSYVFDFNKVSVDDLQIMSSGDMRDIKDIKRIVNDSCLSKKPPKVGKMNMLQFGTFITKFMKYYMETVTSFLPKIQEEILGQN